MFDQNPVETFSCLLKGLSERNVGFVEGREPSEEESSRKALGKHYFYETTPHEQMDNVAKQLRSSFNGVYIANETMTYEKGLEFLRNGWADMISFGRLYISNPDLAERLINNQELNTHDEFSTYFSNFNPKGYIDYPFYD